MARDLLKVPDPIGPQNDEHLLRIANSAGMVICGWGKSVPIIRQRAEMVKAILGGVAELRCLRKNADGSPEHPLYIPADTLDQLYQPKHNRTAIPITQTPASIPLQKSAGAA